MGSAREPWGSRSGPAGERITVPATPARRTGGGVGMSMFARALVRVGGLAALP